ncbi:MAG: ester cyclase [Anaerolineae bacterium]|nr:MAG: ester cyclase [Anaerolineae bacterium]
MRDTPSALVVVSEYVAALAACDSAKMHALHSPDFVLDWVYADAFEDRPRSAEETKAFWPAWFAGFPEMDYEVTRTIAAEKVVVTQWTFTGTNIGPLGPPAFGRHLEPTGRTIQLRGVSIYDVSEGLIQRETTYLDLATLMVELGITL